MPLATLDRNPPPLFRQGPSALSRLVFYVALALFLMVADARFEIARPLRAGLATALYPVQWLLLQPIRLARSGASYFESTHTLEASEREARQKLAEQSARALRAEQLADENEQLRRLLALRERVTAPGRPAEVLYVAADRFSRKIVIGKGQSEGIVAGSAVIDDRGVLGQVTRVYPFASEVTLLVDRDQAIPVLNMRTRARSVAYGEPAGQSGGGLELRFMAGNSDVEVGDQLVTSGGDGVYPAGLPVATVDRIDRRADSAFARIHCTPRAQIAGVRYVLVLDPVPDPIAQQPATADDPPTRKKGRAR